MYMETQLVQNDSSKMPLDLSFLTEPQLQLASVPETPIDDAFMEGFYAGVGYAIVYLDGIGADEFEAAWSYKEAYLNKLKENGKENERT